MGLSAAGAGYSAYATYQGGKAQQALADYNAKLMAQQAEVTERDAAAEANQQRLRSQYALAQQRAVYAMSGVVSDTGSPLLVEAQQAGYMEMNALETERQGQIRAGNYQQQGILDIMQGRASMTGARMGAYGTILKGAASTAGAYAGIG